MSIQSIIDATTKTKPNILVIGDFILDQYIWSDATRISPEAPVPVCRVNDTTYVLGGAGNVVSNLLAFGASVRLAGVIGNDDNANRLQSLLTHSQLNTDLLLQSDQVATICKARVIVRNQQLCRLDYEDVSYDYSKNVQPVLDQLSEQIKLVDAIVISDYAKGLITESVSQHIIQLANQHAVPVIVDPKSVSMNKYKGADYVTPNMSEFKLMASIDAFKNESELYSAAKSLLNESQVKHCLLTRSEKGMSLITPTDKYDFSTKVIEVSDVTGAGDTVVSALALGVALGCDQNDIIEFANHAAGVVVSKLGTATASLKEIQEYAQQLLD
jgi:D-beta-D-heptose 7-phosphate kinase/D-beta-D-heptose 1-phosphate adenosyltransferase